MIKKPRKDIREVIRELGKYPADAFCFVQEGLSYTVQSTHGEMSDTQRMIQQFMIDENLDLDQFEMLYLEKKVPRHVVQLVEEAGGLEELNRHVSGQSLCWGLRDYALCRWGAMASVVLHHWNIRSTRGFGEIVFALVDGDFLQKQPHDTIEDFEEVYLFEDALDRSFEIHLNESIR